MASLFKKPSAKKIAVKPAEKPAAKKAAAKPAARPATITPITHVGMLNAVFIAPAMELD